MTDHALVEGEYRRHHATRENHVYHAQMRKERMTDHALVEGEYRRHHATRKNHVYLLETANNSKLALKSEIMNTSYTQNGMCICATI